MPAERHGSVEVEKALEYSVGGTGPGVLDFPCSVRRLPNGNTLVCDAGTEAGHGSELIELDHDGHVVWSDSEQFSFAHGIEPTHDGTILVADTSNDRVVEFDRTRGIVFSSDDWDGGTGRLSDGTRLSYPNNVVSTPDGLICITDRNNDRAVIVDREGLVHRSFSAGLSRPHNCEPLPGGGAIIADSDGNRVVEVDSDGNTVWQYDTGLNWPRDANRLPNGNTLIVDSKNSRVIEVSAEQKIVWEYAVEYFANFYEAHRLPSGTTLISDQQHKQVIEVDRDGNVVWSFRNYKREAPIHERLTNGFFTKRGDDGFPLSWSFMRRFSEGGGAFFWSEDDRGQPVPAIVFDRAGGLALQQTIAVTPGARYSIGGRIATSGLEAGFACIQVAFRDADDGFLCDAADAPRGATFSGDTDWTEDSFIAVAPANARHADVRLFITGDGVAMFSQVRCFE